MATRGQGQFSYAFIRKALIQVHFRLDFFKAANITGPDQTAPQGSRSIFLQYRLPENSGLFPAILGKGPWPKLGKIIDLTAKLVEINNIEHNKRSKIYPQNQIILDCIKPIILLKHKCLSSILIWVIVSHKV